MSLHHGSLGKIQILLNKKNYVIEKGSNFSGVRMK